MIKGKENTKVKITVYRPAEDKYVQFDILRKRIKTSNIKSEVLEGNIGYIKLVMFDSEIAGYFKNDLNKMLKSGIKGLVIDLRDNPGGSYEQVVEIADSLLPEGVIVYTEDRNGTKQYKNSDKAGFDLPMVLITNGNSASAAEIFAGTLQDYKTATIIGTTSFGKGIVQKVIPLSDGTAVKLTVSKYYTPNGRNIHGTGIKPDVEVALNKDMQNKLSIPIDKDNQLQEAIKLMKQKIKN
jgi:carboxyl-terminal processing protease